MAHGSPSPWSLQLGATPGPGKGLRRGPGWPCSFQARWTGLYRLCIGLGGHLGPSSCLPGAGSRGPGRAGGAGSLLPQWRPAAPGHSWAQGLSGTWPGAMSFTHTMAGDLQGWTRQAAGFAFPLQDPLLTEPADCPGCCLHLQGHQSPPHSHTSALFSMCSVVTMRIMCEPARHMSQQKAWSPSLCQS